MQGIVVCTERGGVGKTTCAIEIAYQLSKKMRVLYIDFDGQSANATRKLLDISEEIEFIEGEGSFEVLCEGKSIRDVARKAKNLKNIDVLMGTRHLFTVSKHLGNGDPDDPYILKNALEKVESDYDFCIIDNNPALTDIKVSNAMVALDNVIVPMGLGKDNKLSVRAVEKFIGKIKSRLNPNLKLISIFPAFLMKDQSGPIKDLIKMIASMKLPTFKQRIPHEVELIRAQNKNLPVGLTAPKSKGAKAYEKITKEILKRINFKMNPIPKVMKKVSHETQLTQ